MPKNRFAAFSLISAFRHIATGRPARELRRLQRVGAHLAQIGALFTVFIFFADTINADILYAAIIGDVQFLDNPLILDSATDSTSVVPDVLQPHVNYFAAAKYDGGATNVHRHIIPRFFGTTIIEDADSPAVLDGECTANLTYDLHTFFIQDKIESQSAVTTLDRTITYGRLLI
jgi:hypothetical protein